MILLAGGSGTLGRFLIPMLSKHEPVTVLTRSPDRTADRTSDNVEVAIGNVSDPESLTSALPRIDVVISAITGFAEKPPLGPAAVDRDGNRNLIRAAVRAGVKHFVLLSILGVSPEHPMELFRMKWEAEEELRRSEISWSVVRPTAYMETWVGILAAPLLNDRPAMVFGRGTNPINFISAADVAHAVDSASVERREGGIAEIGGPDDLGLKDLVETFRSVTGKQGSTRRIPRPMLRLMSVAARPFHAVLARQAGAALVMDTRDMTLAGSLTTSRAIAPSTSLTEMLKRDYAG